MTDRRACPILDGDLVSNTPGARFRLWNPADLREALPGEVVPATTGYVKAAVSLAAEAVEPLANKGPEQRAALLERVIELFEERKESWTQAIHEESGLPLAPRLREIEWNGMIGQLRGAIGLLRSGDWRRVLQDQNQAGTFFRWNVPIGPSVILPPNNFPLRFGGSSGTHFAYAMVAGNPVLVKPHPCITGAEFIAAEVVQQALTEFEFHSGTFAFLPGEADVGEALVDEAGVKLILFTGSAAAASKIRQRNLKRSVPAAERIEAGALNATLVMSSVFEQVTPADLATGIFQGTTPAAGAFCTKDGVLLYSGDIGKGEELRDALAEKYRSATPMLALSRQMAEGYAEAVIRARRVSGVKVLVEGQGDLDRYQAQVRPILLECDLDTFLGSPALHEEVFGPCQIFVSVPQERLRSALLGLPGSLVASVQASVEDIERRERIDGIPDVFFWLSQSVGRVTFRKATTGVIPNPAMVHAGPEPATNFCDTASGQGALAQVVRPFCADCWPDAFLPEWTQMQGS